MGIQTILMYGGVFFGAGTVFALTLLGSSAESEFVGSRQNDEVGSA